MYLSVFLKKNLLNLRMCIFCCNFVAKNHVYSNFGKYRCRKNNSDEDVVQVLWLGA